MTNDELYRFRRAMFILEELSMYANTHELPFIEGKFLNLFGKCESDMMQLFDLMYRPLRKEKNGDRKVLRITETTSIRACRAIAHVLREMNEVLQPKEREP